MKYILLLTYFILLTTSCNTQKSPKNVVQEYIFAIDNLNYEKAKNNLILTDENSKSLDNMKKISDKMSESEKAQYINKKKIYNFIEKEILSTTAKIIVTNNQSDYTITFEFNLKKIKNKWLIDSYKSI